MIEIDYLQVSARIRAAGIKNGIQKAILKAAKNIAAGQPYRIVNKPGDTVTFPSGSSFLVTSKGKLCRI